MAKLCKRCGEVKDLADFHHDARSNDGLLGYCKPCNNARNVEWARTAYGKARKRDSTLRRRFGITAEQYDRALAVQSGGCAICGNLCVSGRSLAVDHCHATGENRGLLCLKCNRALGLLTNTELLQKAIDYLTDPPGREILRRVDVSTTGE